MQIDEVGKTFPVEDMRVVDGPGKGGKRLTKPVGSLERMTTPNLKTRMKRDVTLTKKRPNAMKRGAKSSSGKGKLTGTLLVDSSQPGIRQFLGLIRANLGRREDDSLGGLPIT